MGAPIAGRLIERYSVSVSDTNAARDGVVPDAAWVNSARDLAATSDIFITVLPGQSNFASAWPRRFRRFVKDRCGSI